MSAVLLYSCCAMAQVTYTRHEVGVSANYVRTGFSANLGGIALRYTYNFRPEIALDTSFTFYPQDLPRVANEGGRSFAWFAGPKAGIRRQCWGVFGKAMPGFRHFTSVPEFHVDSISPLQVSTITMGRTHFSMELGGVFELYPNSRWIIRADVSEILSRYATGLKLPEIPTPQGIAVFGYAPGVIHSAVSGSGGIGYRFGERQEQSTAGQSGFHRLEVGVQYAVWNRSLFKDEMMDDSGLGVWGSYYLNHHIAIDGGVTHFWERLYIVAPQEGGNSWQALLGVKLGITRERFGAYAKVRPGVVRFANAVNDEAAFGVRGAFQPVTQFVIDMGGVLEFYPKRHLVIRIDLSDVTIRYGARMATYIGAPSFRWPSYTASTIQTSFGFGWRF